MTETTAERADTRSLLTRARAAMPGLATIESALASVEDRLRQVRGATTGRPEQAVADGILPDVLAGEPIPDDLGDQVLAIRRDNEAAAVEVQTLSRLQDLLHGRLRDTHARQADDGLAVLRRELDALLAAARPVLAELDNIDTADAAIAADRAEQWRQAAQLSDRYRELRRAQLVLVSAALDPDGRTDLGPLVVDYGHITAPDRHDPTVGTDAPDRAEVQLMVTHVAPPDATRPWCTGNTLNDLRYVCRGDVTAWVPTVGELTNARAAHRESKLDEARITAEQPSGAESMFEDSTRLPRTIHNVRPPSWVTEVVNPWGGP